MGGYWVRHRFLLSIFLTLVVALVCVLLFVFPSIEQKANAYNEQSIYRNSPMDFIAPEPSFDQISDLPGSEGISKVFPFYLTKTSVSVNGKTRTTTVLLSDQFENVDITMYNDARLIESLNYDVDNPVFVDWKFCKNTSAKLGDSISFTLSGNKVTYTIQAIYETNSIYDGGAILARISVEQKNLISENASSNGYSAMYVSADDYSACKSFMTTDYRPLGRLRDRLSFDNDEQYKVHYDAIMSSGYANEITDFRVRENGLQSHLSSLMVWLGAIFAAVAIIGFNIVLAARGCEKGYFKKHCIPRGMNVIAYYVISFLFEMVMSLILCTVAFMVRLKLASGYIPKSSISFVILVIPAAIVISEVVSLMMNKSKVAVITAEVEAEEAKKKAEEARRRAEAEKQSQSTTESTASK